MTAFVDYITPETIDSIRAKMKGYAESALLVVSDWIPGAVSQQVLEAVDQALYNVALSTSSLVRGYASLDTSTDPGDVDPYDASNAGLAPVPGYLSAKGEGDYGTPRPDKTFALGTVTLTNGSDGAVTFSVGALTFTSTNPTTGANKTYRNTDGGPTYARPGGGTISANPDGSLTVATGLDVFLPIEAEEIGTDSNATAGQLSLTTVLAIGVTATNASAVLGTERQGAVAYRETCREAGALTSPNGPGDAYRYLAVTARKDGTYGNSTTDEPIGVTRVYVSQEAIAGDVDVYIAGTAGGTALTSYLATVTAIIKTTPGVIACPDAIGINVALAIDTSMSVQFSVKCKASSIPGSVAGSYYTPWIPSIVYRIGQKVFNAGNTYNCTSGGTSTTGAGPTGTGGSISDGTVVWAYIAAGSAPTGQVLAALNAILVSVADYFASVDIGGVDQTAGVGVIYTVDIQDAVATTRINGVSPGFYAPAIAVPVASSTAILLGHVGKLATATGILVLV